MPLPAPPVPYSNGYTNSSPTAILPFSQGSGPTPYQGGIAFEPTGPGVKIVFGPNSPYADLEELFDGRLGVPFQSSMVRTYTRRFRVRTKPNADYGGRSVLLGPVAIANCPGIPVPFAPYIPYRPEEWDYKALAIMIECSQEKPDDSQTWIVTVSYSTEMPPGGPVYANTFLPWTAQGIQNNPWDIPVVCEWDTESYTDYSAWDLDGKQFLNAADSVIFPTPGILRGDRVLTITRNERFYESRVQRYEYKSNSVDFVKGRVYGVGYAYCMGSRATESWLGATKFFRVTYKVLLREKEALFDGSFTPPFNPAKVLNAGLYQKLALFGVAVPGTFPIVRFGQQVSSPILLDENGAVQTALVGGAGPAATQLKPTYISFRLLDTANLNDLLLTGQ